MACSPKANSTSAVFCFCSMRVHTSCPEGNKLPGEFCIKWQATYQYRLSTWTTNNYSIKIELYLSIVKTRPFPSFFGKKRRNRRGTPTAVLIHHNLYYNTNTFFASLITLGIPRYTFGAPRLLPIKLLFQWRKEPNNNLLFSHRLGEEIELVNLCDPCKNNEELRSVPSTSSRRLCRIPHDRHKRLDDTD